MRASTNLIPSDRKLVAFVTACLAIIAIAYFLAGIRVKLENTIALGNILQSFCTVFAAIYVASVINLWSTNRQKEKELLNARFDDILEHLKQIDDFGASVPFAKIPPFLKKLSLKCQILIDCGKASTTLDVDEVENEMKQRVKELRDLLTYAKASDAENHNVGTNEIRVVSGTLLIGSQRHERICRSIEKFQRWIWITQIELTRK